MIFRAAGRRAVVSTVGGVRVTTRGGTCLFTRTGLFLTAGVLLFNTESSPVCPKPLTAKTAIKKEKNINFTQVDYAAKIYGTIN